MLRQLWMNEEGFVVSAELTLIATVLVVGMLVGLVSVRDQVVQELGDIAVSLGAMNQSYSFSWVRCCSSYTAGSCFYDTQDYCDDPAHVNNWSGSACVDVFSTPSSPEGPFTYPDQLHPHTDAAL